MNDAELEKRFGLTPEGIERDSSAYDSGDWPKGRTVLVGRPPMHGVRMVSVTYRDTEREVAAMDARAASLGMRRSDYIRSLVRRDLDRATA